VEEGCIWRRLNSKGQLESLLIYVDDILAAGPKGVRKAVLDLGFELSKPPQSILNLDFLGVTLEPDDQGLRLSTKKYVEKLARPPWKGKQPNTPLPLKMGPPNPDSPVITNPRLVTVYRGMVGQISWLSTVTRPELSYCAHYPPRGTSAPTLEMMELANRAMQYVCNTNEFGTFLPKPQEGDVLCGFVDASHRSVAEERKGIAVYIVGILRKLSKVRDAEGCLTREFFPLAWKSVNQPSKTNSSMATELVALHSASVMLCFMQRFFVELSKCMDMWLLTDAKNNIDQLGSMHSTQPVDLDLKPLLDILKQKIVHQAVQVAHLEREFMLADELTTSRPGVLLR